MMNDNFMIDFDDMYVAKIYTDRWLHTANLIGVMYQHAIIPFGDNKFHYRVALNGPEDDIIRFMEFINKSLDLLDGSEITHEN